MTDERGLQTIVDKHINTGTEFDIKIMRVEDIVKWIKDNPECDIPRKLA